MARRTKNESAQTRESILDAAEWEMQSHGVSQTSLERIARRARVTRGAIYWHFGDKRALLEAMVSRTHLPLRDMRHCLSQHIPGDEPLRLLREMIRHGLERLTHDERHRRVCHILLHRCEVSDQGYPADSVIAAMFEDARTVLQSLCEEIESQGQLREPLTPRDATDLIAVFMSGHYECALRHSGSFLLRDDWTPQIDAFLRGIFEVPYGLAEQPSPGRAG